MANTRSSTALLANAGRWAALVLAATVFGSSALAQQVRQYRAGDSVDPREVARILGGTAPQAGAPKFRSLRVLGEPMVSAPLPIEGGTSGGAVKLGWEKSAGTPTTVLSLPVQFGFDSATILPQARNHLDALAAGIKLVPTDQFVMIEGHTDAVGAEAYNLQLSTRRAIAVKEYLVRAHGIDAGRLATEGFGMFRPLNQADGRAAENRRVQFRGG
jgi:outer membrane protein OmpA-like peptidoglycan-associated protein